MAVAGRSRDGFALDRSGPDREPPSLEQVVGAAPQLHSAWQGRRPRRRNRPAPGCSFTGRTRARRSPGVWRSGPCPDRWRVPPASRRGARRFGTPRACRRCGACPGGRAWPAGDSSGAFGIAVRVSIDQHLESASSASGRLSMPWPPLRGRRPAAGRPAPRGGLGLQLVLGLAQDLGDLDLELVQGGVGLVVGVVQRGEKSWTIIFGTEGVDDGRSLTPPRRPPSPWRGLVPGRRSLRGCRRTDSAGRAAGAPWRLQAAPKGAPGPWR
jgi:hypothetical protein